jgi:ribosomal protein S18 acetylase RimI-like enzyme
MSELTIKYRQVDSIDLEALRLFISENGWAERVANRERFRAMVTRANRAVVALEGTRIVGFARALCDGVSNGYISMVVVAEDVRRTGIGRRLVEEIMQDDSEGKITWVLRAGRDSTGFWRQLGFKNSEIAMERVRK